MSITTEILRIKGGKSDIRTLASQKNINIPSTSLIDSYATVLGQNWPNCTYGVTYESNKIRGMTKRCDNLLDLRKNFPTIGLTTVEKNENYLKVTSLSSRGRMNATLESFNGTVYLSFKVNEIVNSSTMFIGFAILHQNGTYSYYSVNPTTTGEYSVSAPVSATDTSIRFDVNVNDTSNNLLTPNKIVLSNIMISKNNAPFEVYFDGLKYAYYKGIKLGTYDYIDISANKLVLGGKERIVNGSENWITTSHNKSYAYNLGDAPSNINGDNVDIIFDKLPTTDWTFDYGNNSFDAAGFTYSTSSFQSNIFIKSLSTSNIDSFKSWLSSNNIKFYYKLVTPIEIDL